MRSSSALGVFAVLCLGGLAHAQSTVYEGFGYIPGETPAGSMGGGTGWSGAFAGTGSVEVLSASLTAPAARPTTGRAIRWGSDFNGVTLTRNFAAAFPASSEVWMSFIFRMDNFPSSFSVRLGGANGPGVGNGISGISVSRGDGTVFMSGLHEFSESLMLMRFGADAGGTRTLSVWANPAPGALGAPTVSVTGPSGALGSLHLSLGYETAIDEFRVDTNLANVFVPSGGAAGVLGTLAVAAGSRRRR